MASCVRLRFLVGRGGSLGEAIPSIGVTDQTYYRWRKEYGGLKMDQAKRLKELERDNTRLREAVADLTSDKQVLTVRAVWFTNREADVRTAWITMDNAAPATPSS